MKHLILTSALLTAAISAAIADGISLADLANLPKANVVVLGEVHDNGLHHKAQAQALAMIRPKAVVFEMLSAQQAARLTPELLNDQAALEKALAWGDSGWPDFSLYYPVFAALSGARVYGAARPRTEVRRAFADGAAAVFGEGFGLDQALPAAELEQRKLEQFEAHCKAMPLEMMGGMVEAQRFRDAAFAATVVEAFKATGGPVVLIAGNGHARKDWGVPSLLPELSVLSIGFLERPAENDPPFDLWIVADPAKRDDPCLAFN